MSKNINASWGSLIMGLVVLATGMTISTILLNVVSYLPVHAREEREKAWLATALEHEMLINILEQQCSELGIKEVPPGSNDLVVFERPEPRIPEVLQLLKVRRVEISNAGIKAYRLYGRGRRIGFQVHWGTEGGQGPSTSEFSVIDEQGY